MSDPFANVDAAPPEMVEIIAAGLETRGNDPAMRPVIDAYVAALELGPGHRLVEIGAGTGAVLRQIAAAFPEAQMLGIEPSKRLVDRARTLGEGHPNLSFQVGDGAALNLADASFDAVVLHTLLSHVTDPAVLIAEAVRVLRPGGQIVICDADFSKASLGLCPGDPLGACAEGFVANNVTNAWLTAELRPLAKAAGLQIDNFTIVNRVVTDGMGLLIWTRLTGSQLVAKGVIGPDFAAALETEYTRRAKAGTLYGFLPFATLIARKPA